MKFARNPLTTLVLAGLIGAAGLTAVAQTPPPPPPGATAPQHGPRHGADPAQRQAMVAKHLAALKDKLRITSTQEGAWSAFASAMTPPAQPRPPFDREAFAKLSTPERIDRLQQLRAERNARMDQRAAATKTFYAQLNADQKKTFDEVSLRFMKHGGHHGHGGPGPRG